MQSAFVLCLPRSGSTLLSWLLDTHPEVSCPPELYLSKAVEQLEVVLRQTTGAHLPLDAQRRFVAEEVRKIVAAPIEAYASARGKRIWVEKTPLFTIEALPSMVATFPEARWFALYRGCLDVMRSCLEHATYVVTLQGLAPYFTAVPENRIEALARYWCDYTDRMLGFEQRNPKTCLRVRYEDLARDPATAAPRIFEHLGVGFPEGLLERVFTSDHGVGKGDGKILFKRGFDDESNKGRLLPWGLIFPRTRERIEALSAKLGYPPLAGDPAEPFPEDVARLFDETVPARLQATPAGASGITCKFSLGSGATTKHWIADFRGEAPRIVSGDGYADCTASSAAVVFREIAAGRVNAVTAFEDGRLKIEGNKQLAFVAIKALFFPSKKA